MKRKLTSILLFSALLAGGASTFVSCTDNESDNAYNASVSLADVIAKQKTELAGLNEWLGDLRTKNPSLADAIDARIKENLAAMDKGAINELGQYATLDEAIQASKSYQGLKSEIAAIEKLRQSDSLAHAKLDSALQAQIDTAAAHVSSLEEMQAKMQKSLDYLVNKNLANIAINATENPVVGEWNAAFIGSQLNLAAAYYGVAAEGNEDWDVKAGNVLGKNGDAGYIYVSLNPTELDPANITELKLVDSQGNEAKGFKLGDLKETNKVLTYGYTRAASANGFYAIPVTCTDPQNDDFSLNKGELKAAAKNVLDKLKNPSQTNLQLADIATTLYRSLNNQLKAYTVKATYYLYDATTGELVKKTQVAPTYNMAAFAVKPLSFAFAKDNQYLDKLGLTLDKFHFVTLSDKLNKIAKALDVKVSYDKANEFYTYTFIASNTIFCEEKDGNVYMYNDAQWAQNGKDYTLINRGHLYKTFENSTLEVNVLAQDDDYVGERIYTIKTKDNTIAELINSVNNQIANKLQPLQNVLNNAKLNNYVEKFDNYVPKLNNLLHKITSNIGNVNRLLQPTLMYVDQNNNWNFVSTANHFGSRFTGLGATTMVATSYTAEYLAPAYKKSIYVKEAGAEILVDGKTIKEGDTFSGNVHKIVFNATKAGKYTIVYKAIDYSGVEVEKNFYITVK